MAGIQGRLFRPCVYFPLCADWIISNDACRSKVMVMSSLCSNDSYLSAMSFTVAFAEYSVTPVPTIRACTYALPALM